MMTYEIKDSSRNKQKNLHVNTLIQNWNSYSYMGAYLCVVFAAYHVRIGTPHLCHSIHIIINIIMK